MRRRSGVASRDWNVAVKAECKLISLKWSNMIILRTKVLTLKANHLLKYKRDSITSCM